MPTQKEMDEIDKIVDDVIEGPEVAKAVKDALHDALGSDPEPTQPKADPTNTDDDDGDDLWENLPV